MEFDMGLWSYFKGSSDPHSIKKLDEGAVRRLRGDCPLAMDEDE